MKNPHDDSWQKQNRDINFSTMKLIESGRQYDNDQILQLKDMVDSKIVDVGFHPMQDREGGLTFDYEKDGVVKRIVIAYTELGMWIEWSGEKK